MPLTREIILRSRAFRWAALAGYAASMLWINMLWFGILFAPGTDTPPPDAGLPWPAIGLSVLFVMFTLAVFSCLVVDRYAASAGVNTVIFSTFCVVALFLELGIGFSTFRLMGFLFDDFSYFDLLYNALGLTAFMLSFPVLLMRMNFIMFAPAPDRPGAASQGTNPPR